MSFFLALFQCQNRHFSTEQWLVFQKRLWVTMQCCAGHTVSCMVSGCQACPRELRLCQHCPRVPHVFYLHLPGTPLGLGLLLAPHLPGVWHPKLFLPPGLLSCYSLPGMFSNESAWLPPPPQWRVSFSVTSEIPSLTPSGKVPVTLTPTPITVFQTLVCCWLVCFSSVLVTPNPRT